MLDDTHSSDTKSQDAKADTGLRYADFAQAGVASYGPAWMWIWNDTLSRNTLRREVLDMSSHSQCTLMPVPEPKEFRPNSMVTCLSPEYLSDGYMMMYRYMVEQAEKAGAEVWVYDEGGWPSGTVCWSLPAKYPQFQAQSIQQQVIKPQRDDVVSIPVNYISAFLFDGPTMLKQLPLGSTTTIDRDDTRVLIYKIVKDTNYTDLLNPKATQMFIDMVHEKYRSALGDHFGDTITAVFSDEPKMATKPWTDDMVPEFERRYGYDLRDHIYALFEDNIIDGMQTRVDYYDFISDRWSKTYFKRIMDWCHRNHTQSVCHLDQDHDLSWQARFNGNPLRQYRQMDIPAIDVIWRQIFPGNTTSYFPKFASSVAHQDGKPRVCSETFCVYSNGLTPEQMKWILDYQYVRGINWFMPGVYQYSTREFFQAGERPIFGPGDPLWKHLDRYFGYVSRLSYLLTRGAPDVSIALYTPFRDLWAGTQTGEPTDMAAVKLLESQCDFDIIDDDMLEAATTKVSKGTIHIGHMSYDTLCVPQCEWISDKSIAKLERFAASGGKVLWIANQPGMPRIAGSQPTPLNNLSRHVKPLVHATTATDKLRVCRRKLTDGHLYFITNEDTQAINSTLEFDENLPLVILDPETGTCSRPLEASYAAGRWTLPINLPFAGSFVVLFTAEKLPVVPTLLKAARVLMKLDKGWSYRKVMSYALGNKDYDITQLSNERYLPAQLGDWRSTFGEAFSGDVEYRIEFECGSNMAAQAAVLELGEVRYVCDVTLNSEHLGVRLWQPWSFPVSGKLKIGMNELNIIVTNTLANQYVYSHELDKYPDKYLGSYHQRALSFERESISSGLFGPVQIWCQ